MTTMREVAREANVSVATVSHVINGTRFVDPTTTERVRRAITALRYRPNMLARSLRRRETRTIGLLVPDNANPFFADMARVIEDAGFAEGYSVILCNSDRSELKEEAYIDVLLAKQVDGLIVISSTDRTSLLRRVIDAQVPVVVVDRDPAPPEASQVLVANDAGGYAAGRYLVELGHRRIGCIGGPSDTNPSWGRVRGFARALEEAGVRLAPEALVPGDFRYAGGEAAMRALLERDLGLSAVFAANDLMAIGAMGVLRAAGLRVPDDLSLVGFDNIHLASLVTPALTTVEQPTTEVGKGAVRLLLDQIAKPDGAPGRIDVATRLVVRQSCRSAVPVQEGGEVNG
jgi:LacI family transcriptional regulator